MSSGYGIKSRTYESAEKGKESNENHGTNGIKKQEPSEGEPGAGDEGYGERYSHAGQELNNKQESVGMPLGELEERREDGTIIFSIEETAKTSFPDNVHGDQVPEGIC